MSDEHGVDPRVTKLFNQGYWLEKGGAFQDLMKEQKNPKFLGTDAYKALDAGRQQAQKDNFRDKFKSKGRDKDHEK